MKRKEEKKQKQKKNRRVYLNFKFLYLSRLACISKLRPWSWPLTFIGWVHCQIKWLLNILYTHYCVILDKKKTCYGGSTYFNLFLLSVWFIFVLPFFFTCIFNLRRFFAPIKYRYITKLVLNREKKSVSCFFFFWDKERFDRFVFTYYNCSDEQ